MMVRSALQRTPLTKELEDKICTEFFSKHFGIVPVISLAGYLAREGLQVEAYHQDKHKFWDLLKQDTIGLKVTAYRYDQAISQGVKLYEPPLIDEKFLKERLSERKLLICGTMYRSSGVRHAVVLYNSSDQHMHIIDPLDGKLSLTGKELMRIMQTFTGVWCISVAKN
jgi:hypothetical protein